MRWATRADCHVDRIGCARLIRRFIDPEAATFAHEGHKCTFEVLIDRYHLDVNPALVRLARIVHAADIDSDRHTDAAGPGLLAIGIGDLDVEPDDDRLLARGLFLYDALYAWCQRDTR